MAKLDTALRLDGWRGRALDFIVGAIAVLGLAPFYIWPLALLCFGWLAIRLARAAERRENAAKICRSRALWFAMGYFIFGLFWIGAAFIARGPSYIPLMVPAVLLLCAVLSLFWVIAAHVYAKLKPHGLWALVIFASLMSMTEIARGHVFSGFPWNLPGYIFKAGGSVSQSASVIGIYGLTFLTLLIAGALGHCLSARTHDLNLPRKSGIMFLLILGGLYGFGFLRLQAAPPLEFHNGVKLRIVQTPFDQKDNLDRLGSIGITNDYLTQTASEGLEDISHVIWPEGALGGLALENENLMRAVSDLFLSFDDTPPVWLPSSLREEIRPASDGTPVSYYYNSSAAITFDADGSAAISTINDKMKLVPFGEGLPAGRFLERFGLTPMSTASSFVTPAPVKELAIFPGLPKLSPQICYEIIFPAMTPHPKNAPSAEWILNQSNDGWYGKSTGPRQHANQAAYRAIEEGLPIVRAAGNGISGVIDPYGRWYTRVGPEATAALDTKLPKSIARPLFSINQIWLLFLINLASCLLYYVRETQRRGA